MNEWLYAEGGYYRGVGQVGRGGDFLTSPSVSMFFGGSIANKFVSLVQSGKLSENAVVCEFGANSLYALKDFASFLAGLAPHLLKTVKFVIVERQPEAAAFQQKELKEFFSDVEFEIVESLRGFEDRDAFVFANEIFDAFLCELFYEGKTAIVKNGKIEFVAEDGAVAHKASALGVRKGEIAVGYEEFAEALFGSFKNTYFTTFDYGQEYPRNDFSIRVYKEHKTEPLFGVEELGAYFKNSDITYDVNFGHLQQAFEGAGFVRDEYKRQGLALMDYGMFGLLEIYREKAGDDAYAKEVQKAKALISPDGFGERFKMISFKKGF